ncbi:MAG TPA: prolyl oligopeptidase family serine peptidase, partial [Fimbriimonas sp.]
TESRKKWPLLLFLHGAGERGEDLEKMKVHGPMKEIVAGRQIPAIVVAPQCPEGEGWNTDTLVGLLDHLESRYRVDKDRVYLSGISMGGFGTWALAMEQPERFAAIAPVCGGGNTGRTSVIKDIPTWVVHGDKDEAVPIRRSIEMVDALKAAGGRPIFTIVPGGGHDVWTDFYGDDAFYAWLFSHKRPGRARH